MSNERPPSLTPLKGQFQYYLEEEIWGDNLITEQLPVNAYRVSEVRIKIRGLWWFVVKMKFYDQNK